MGASKPVFKAHGDSKAKTFKNALRLTKAYVEGNVVDEITRSVADSGTMGHPLKKNKPEGGIHMDYRELEKNLQYHFKDTNYLINALTHSSYANEHKKSLGSNERLEFLGDSILGIVVADYLFKNYPELPEGDLTRNRAALVCRKGLLWLL